MQMFEKILSKKFGVIAFSIWLLSELAGKYQEHALLCIWLMFALAGGYTVWQAWYDYVVYGKKKV